MDKPQYRSRWQCAWGESLREYLMAIKHKDNSALDKYAFTFAFPLLVFDRYVNAMLDGKTGRWFHRRTVESFGFRPPYSICPEP